MNEVICGDAADILSQMKSNFIDLVITSPPYDNLREYNGFTFDFDAILSCLYKVVKDGGIIVWVVNDALIKGSESLTSFKQAVKFVEAGFNLHDTMIYEKNSPSFPAVPGKSKRYTQIFEYMFVFSKGKPKTINLLCDKSNIEAGKDYGNRAVFGGKKYVVPDFSIRNNIWRYNTSKGNKFKHPAPFPEQLAADHILSWSNEEDLILDPMCGSGTVLVAAKKLNRKYIGIDISEEYCSMSIKRLKESSCQ